MRRSLITFVLVLAATGCSDFPQLDGTISARARSAAYPRILPLDGLMSGVAATGTGAELGNLPARLARLRGRARAMRASPVVDGATRARMMAALARYN